MFSMVDPDGRSQHLEHVEHKLAFSYKKSHRDEMNSKIPIYLQNDVEAHKYGRTTG